MTEEQKYKLEARVLSGNATEDDQRRWEAWLMANPQEQEPHELLTQNWSATNSPAPNQKAVFERISKRLPFTPTEEHPRIKHWYRAANLAACVLALFALWVGLSPVNPPEAPPGVTLITKTNPVGQKMKTYLPDGTVVVLNSESTLSYPSKFLGTERLVELSGEAYFDVAEDKNMPFRVVTQNITTTALGTSFNIRAFKHESSIEVDLESGLVDVEYREEQTQSEQHYKLTPGQAIIYDRTSNQVHKGTFDPKARLSWKDGIIYFQKASQNEVIETLERWYGVTFHVENQTGSSWHYSGSFKNQNLQQVLNSISFTKKFTYRIENETVYITFQKPKPM
ncbi:FecR family protein [Marinoscillum furvescens]|uniref:FecR family protein n=1 Tax=Marinoscillum furvescens DSM 4134 TaxID=1122208 RepID=A0A3D9KZ82_MARFU|nr:FecR family protein [Marinoscillum furvescens]RED93014.1 FecR family protein [Marinoscillum furvescens DSM 4134]